MQLDLTDHKILFELDNNSRQSFNKLAKKVRLSKDVANYRVKRLESEKYILGYQTIIDFTRLGFFAIRLQLSLLKTSPEKEKEIIKFLVNQKEVFLVSESEGQINLTVGLLIKNVFQLTSFQKDLEERFKENISVLIVSVYEDVYHFSRKYLIEKQLINEKKISISNKKNPKFDEMDILILKLLSKNAKIPTIEIAKKLKTNANTIAFRIKKMEREGIIIGYKILFNFNKINYIYVKTELFMSNISRQKEIIEFCKQQKHIVYLSKTIGGSDIEIYFEIGNIEKYLEIMKELREKFPEINKWNYTIFSKYHKFSYFID